MAIDRMKGAAAEYIGGEQWRKQGWCENLWLSLMVVGVLLTTKGVVDALQGDAWAALFGIAAGLLLLTSGMLRSPRWRRRRSQTR